MYKISRQTKSELFQALLKEKNPFGDENNDNWILGFLDDVWDLSSMPSEDSRFSDAYRDVIQHTVLNDDWAIDYLFLERLKLLEDNSIYSKFLETIVSKKYRTDEDEIVKFVLLINSYLEKEKCLLAVSEFDEEGIPVYRIQNKVSNRLFNDLPQNKIDFYVVKDYYGDTRSLYSHTTPAKTPAFVLVFNNRWNDYDYKTQFSLFYYNSKKEGCYIGETKITNGDDERTEINMLDKCKELSLDYCSLGQSFSYYKNLKEAVGKNFENVLYALKDAAFFPDVNDKFENNVIFNLSLKRSDRVERLLREVKHRIYGYELNNLYSFKYSFLPKYSKDKVEVEFGFNSQKDFADRIFALIGKNGTGKTQLITSLPLDIARKNNELFVPRPPMFSKVIAVSYSVFDDFEIPKKTSNFNYVYCGLQSMKGEKKEALSKRQLYLRFHKAWRRIKEKERMKKWRSILLNFIEEEIVNTFIITDKDDPTKLTVDTDKFSKNKHKLSSGQSIILFTITEIVSNIRFDSLILFDEPETHLHPNAISQLMNTIYELVEEFESYCIVTTHSPLIIRELLSRNVYVFERHENLPSIRKIGIESFGENLSILTDEVFGNRNIEKQYKKIIDRFIDTGLTYDDILDQLKSDEIELSLNTRLYIKSKIK